MKAGVRAGLAVALAALLASCGGGGDEPAPPATLSNLPFAGICTLEDQKRFTWAYLNDFYLWYSEMPAVDASQFGSVPQYFYSLLTPQLDTYGQKKDRFSFIAKIADADSLESGSNLGYGVRWEQDGQGRTRVAYTDAGSPAANAGLQRGGELVSAPADAHWYTNGPGSISFVYRSDPTAATQTVNLTAAEFQEDPVPLSTSVDPGGGRRVWYVLFDAHTVGAQDKLISELTKAKAYGVQDLVLDMRYNGGGYLYTAMSLASMVAGSSADGQVFEQLRFNDKRKEESALNKFEFSGQVQYGESDVYRAGTPLPRLALPRVYVLSSDGTCSASESVVNGLRGVDVEVVIIGKTTCGKPYGFTRTDNCGYAYYPIEFQGSNAKGFGEYTNGFAPTCDVADDFDNALGSSSERLLSTALYHMQNGTCPPQAVAGPRAFRALPVAPAPAAPMRGRWLTPRASAN